MAGPSPTAAFASSSLLIATVGAGQAFGRIHRQAYPEPLGYGKNASRFSDPRRRLPKNRFGVIYLGSSLRVCFLEAVLRDLRDGLHGPVDMAETELEDRLYSRVAISQDLELVDLRGDGPLKMGSFARVDRSPPRRRVWRSNST